MGRWLGLVGRLVNREVIRIRIVLGVGIGGRYFNLNIYIFRIY